MRKTVFANSEYYHIYNRGVDKRDIFMDHYDFERFLLSMKEFNSSETIGSIYENSFRKKDHNSLGNSVSKSGRLVEFVAYCLNPNHYHFLVKQVADKGVEKFMHKIGLGYSKYFNHKYERSGALFQGTFKAKHVDSHNYLLHVGAYVDLNFKVHGVPQGKYRSSWEERGTNHGLVVNKDIILSQLRKKSDYRNFATQTVAAIKDDRNAKNQDTRVFFME